MMFPFIAFATVTFDALQQCRPQVLNETHRHPTSISMTIARFGLVDDEEIEIDLAALELSELDHPGTDISSYANLLQTMGHRLSVIGADAHKAVDQAEALAATFHGEFAFTGDVASYDAPLNGDLIRVLDRRRGLPVSLSILYVAAARRMGWAADALNTPGHVLVRIGKSEPVVIDPFNDGALVTNEQLVALLVRASKSGSQVTAAQAGPMSNRDILVRLLINQASRAEQAGDTGRAMTLYQRMSLVGPSNPDSWWSLARLQLRAGLIDHARASLGAMLEVTRDKERRDVIAATLDAISEA